MFGKESIPQLILLRRYQRFIGRERTIVVLGQKLISQWGAFRPPSRGRRLILLVVEPLRGRQDGSRFCLFLLYYSDFPPSNLNLSALFCRSTALI